MAKIMTREIKFRVWDGNTMWYDDTKTIDGNEVSLHFYSSKSRNIGWGLYDNKLGNRLVTGDPKAIFHSPGVIMQHTGLTDKNGKEIYEGDIVFCNTKGKIQWPHQGKVEYVGQGDNYYCGYFAINCGKNEDEEDEFTHFWNNENFKVIGNIYENSNEKCSTM